MAIVSDILTSQRSLAFCFLALASPAALGMYDRTVQYTYVQLCRHLVFPFACLALGLQWRVALVENEQQRVKDVLKKEGNEDSAKLKGLKQDLDDQHRWTTMLLKVWTAISLLDAALAIFMFYYERIYMYLRLPRYGTFATLAPIPDHLMENMYPLCVALGSTFILACWVLVKPNAGDLSEFEETEAKGEKRGNRGEKRKRGKGRR